MREIKFRLLDENNKIVGYERWYVGAFNMEHKKDYYVAQPCWMYSKDEKYWNPEIIKHRYKEQFSEVLDKSLKEIYEGDIINGTPSFTQRRLKLIERISAKEVYWSGSGFYVSGNPMGIQLIDIYDREIIGNIHETPELLEKK